MSSVSNLGDQYQINRYSNPNPNPNPTPHPNLKLPPEIRNIIIIFHVAYTYILSYLLKSS